MGYFRELPNLLYQSFLPSKNSSLDYIEVKNLFRRAKIRDDLQSVFTLFNKYEIPDEFRPENVAEDYYGSDELDWVVLLSANGPINTSGIINARNDWPLSNRNLYNYALNKYGDNLNSTRFYETKEIKDSKGHIILPKGRVVDANFKSPLPSLQSSIVTTKFTNTFTNDPVKIDVTPGVFSWRIIEPLDTKKEEYYTKTELYGKFTLNLIDKTWDYTKDNSKIEAITSGFISGEKIVTDTLTYTSTDGNNRTINIKIKVTEGEPNTSEYIPPTTLTDIVNGFTSVSYIQYWDTTLGYNVTKYGTDVRTGLSNWDYETRLNEQKRSIFLLKPEYLQQFLNDFRDIMVYDRSSEYVNSNLIKTENTNITNP